MIHPAAGESGRRPDRAVTLLCVLRLILHLRLVSLQLQAVVLRQQLQLLSLLLDKGLFLVVLERTHGFLGEVGVGVAGGGVLQPSVTGVLPLPLSLRAQLLHLRLMMLGLSRSELAAAVVVAQSMLLLQFFLSELDRLRLMIAG